MNEQPWQILALKYDRRPHYTWPAIRLPDDGEQLRFRSIIGGVLVHHTRGFQELTRRPSDLTFWPDRWYNVFTNFHENGALRNFYCNVAMPPTLQDHTITFIDLDLDVRVFPDGTHQLLDEDEFDLHRVQYGYPDWVQAKARQAVRDIIALAESGQGPFKILTR